jgi:hypothetical protein
MKQIGLAILLLATALTFPARAQGADPAPALNQPDMVSWQLFAQVNAPAASANNNNVLFETWASDQDTFRPNPVWPGAPTPMVLRAPALAEFRPVRPGLQPRVLPGGSEETRRNKVTFDFIVTNNLYKRSGLRAWFASGKDLTLPIDSIEVKANWVPASTVNAALYHVNTASDGQQYALVSMHIISKQIPNWTWATFEHQNNEGRCDYIGCKDHIGAVVPFVAPEPPAQFGKIYPACQKTAAVLEIFKKYNLAAVYQNYCLKGSQTDFITATGQPTLLGNSVTEDGFSNTSSCMTCHSRAAFNQFGRPFPNAGFIEPPVPTICPVPNASISGCSPNGSPQQEWFWTSTGTPPQQKPLFRQADFIWAIPLRAIDQ